MTKLLARMARRHVVAALRPIGRDVRDETIPYGIAGGHSQHLRERARVDVSRVSAKLEGEPARAKLVGCVSPPMLMVVVAAPAEPTSAAAAAASVAVRAVAPERGCGCGAIVRACVCVRPAGWREVGLWRAAPLRVGAVVREPSPKRGEVALRPSPVAMQQLRSDDAATA